VYRYATGPKQSPGEIRLAKDISELVVAPTIGIEAGGCTN
jgi:hypothetical protein